MKKTKNKIFFKVKDNDGAELELYVKTPDNEQSKELQTVYNKAYGEALKTGAPIKAKVAGILREQKVITEDTEEEKKKLNKEIANNRIRILKGGMPKTKGYELAIQCLKNTQKLQQMEMPRAELEANTCEGIAFNKQFNHTVLLCTYDSKTHKKYFDDYDDLSSRLNDEDAQESANQMSYLLAQLEPNYREKLPEYKFLKLFNYVDDKLRMINSEGHLVDFDGKLIDENGRFVNNEGALVDEYGYLIDEDGQYIVDDTSEFTDD